MITAHRTISEQVDGSTQVKTVTTLQRPSYFPLLDECVYSVRLPAMFAMCTAVQSTLGLVLLTALWLEWYSSQLLFVVTGTAAIMLCYNAVLGIRGFQRRSPVLLMTYTSTSLALALLSLLLLAVSGVMLGRFKVADQGKCQEAHFWVVGSHDPELCARTIYLDTIATCVFACIIAFVQMAVSAGSYICHQDLITRIQLHIKLRKDLNQHMIQRARLITKFAN